MSSTALTPKEKGYLQSLLTSACQDSSGSHEDGSVVIANTLIFKVRNDLLNGDTFEFTDIPSLNPADMGSF